MISDFKFALRQLRKSPSFTLIAILTLALGIGLNTSMFTALQALLMRQLPYPHADRLVQVFRTSPHSQRWPHSPANFIEQRENNNVFESMAALVSKPLSLAEPGQSAERVHGMFASAELFAQLGVSPALGRAFTPEEDHPGKDQVAVLSHDFWLRRFGGDASVIGRTVRLEGQPVVVIGIMPARFNDTLLFGPVDLWQPIAFTDGQRQDRWGNYLKSFALLKPGISPAQAQTAMDVIAASQAHDHPDTNSGIGLRIVPLAESIDPRGRAMIWLTMALAGCVLLIACANIANLQFARIARRTHELAIRGALGASRRRLLRQLLTESILLAILGGGFGLIAASWGNDFLSRQIVIGDENLLALTLNFRVFGFALAASLLAGLTTGLLPAWLASRANVNSALKLGPSRTTDSRSQHRLQHALIVAEVALALMLLSAAGLVVRGLHQLTFQNPGWQVEGLTTGYLSLPQNKYPDDATRRAFSERLQQKLAALPGVQQAVLAWSLPVTGFSVSGDFKADGHQWPQGQEPIRFVNGVTPGYFAALHMQLVSGRDFAPTDTAGSLPVVVINQTMARALWPGESPLGKRIDDQQVIGVVNDVQFPANPTKPDTNFQTYLPIAQGSRAYFAIALRGVVSAQTLRATVATLDADLPVNEPGTAAATVERTLSNVAIAGRMLGSFAVLGLLLASLGIYGVLAGFVVQRTSEIGLRIALGAQLQEVLRLVIGQGLRLTLIGTGIGLLGAFALSRLVRSLAPGLDPNPPLVIFLASGTLVLVALLACYLPARRATKVDPMVALRAE